MLRNIDSYEFGGGGERIEITEEWQSQSFCKGEGVLS